MIDSESIQGLCIRIPFSGAPGGSALPGIPLIALTLIDFAAFLPNENVHGISAPDDMQAVRHITIRKHLVMRQHRARWIPVILMLAAIAGCDSRIEVVESPQDATEREAANDEEMDRFFKNEFERIKDKRRENDANDPEDSVNAERFHSEIDKLRRKVHDSESIRASRLQIESEN